MPLEAENKTSSKTHLLQVVDAVHVHAGPEMRARQAPNVLDHVLALAALDGAEEVCRVHTRDPMGDVMPVLCGESRCHLHF